MLLRFASPSSSLIGRARLHPVAAAIAGLLIAGSAQAQQAFSAAWMAQKNMAQGTAAATGRLPNGMPASSLMAGPQAQQQRANETLQRSLSNLNLAAQGIAAQQAAQDAARRAAQGAPSDIPDGLAEGGLKVDTNSLTAGWTNARAPQQSAANGRTTVRIEQTADKAILNWETFNVGKNTTLKFEQQPSWSVLNRVNDPQARPSQIRGQIQADGTVMIANRNGIVFSGSSQVDTRNLVAAAARITDAQYRERGIYGAPLNDTVQPSFTDAAGAVTVEAGARIATHAPSSVKQGGGYVLLMGREVHNAGELRADRGQVQLAAGDAFAIRKGVGSEINTYSTTRGNEIAPQVAQGSSAGLVRNTGLIVAREGDVTLAGREVRQEGVALATTSVAVRGTVHLLNSAADKQGRVVLGEGALTAVLLDAERAGTALDSQREALIAASAEQDRRRTLATPGLFDNLSRQQDRRDLSRVEIVSGNDALFDGGSLTLATGGQIAVSAARRAVVARNAQLDVAGAVGVSVAMSSNNVQVNVQGNEQRDAPLNRDTGKLNNVNVWIDRRRLSYVPAKPGVYDKDRYYTAGGLLEVGGYLGNQPHALAEWMAQGGTVLLGGAEVVTQRGSVVNLSGGTLDVQTGYVNQSWLKGSDGRLYRLDRAPIDVTYEGLYRGFEDEHARWGRKTTGFFYNPLIGPQRQLENGYTVGRDAGRLVVSAPTAVLEGDIAAQVFTGERQTQARSAASDGYLRPHTAVARAGTLALRRMGGVGFDGAFDTRVRIGEVADIGDALHAADAALAKDRIGTAFIDAARLGGFGLGGLEIVTAGEVALERALQLADGGRLDIAAALTRIDAPLTIRSGSVAVGNVAPLMTTGSPSLGQPLMREGAAAFALGEAGRIDLRGRWTNHVLDGRPEDSLAFIDGGSFSARLIDGAVTLARGSVIDVSSGATLSRDGRLVGGRGGDVTLQAGAALAFGTTPPPGSAVLRVDGQILSYGVRGGGALQLQSPGGAVFGHDAWLAAGVLPAGTPAPSVLRLGQALRIETGERLPLAVRTEYHEALRDVPLPFTLSPLNSRPIAIAADWTLPAGVSAFTPQRVYQPGERVPAGTQIGALSSLPPGTVVPSAVFPQGLPVQFFLIQQAAGEAAIVPTTYAAGQAVPTGTVFARQVAFEPPQPLSPALLQSGFSSYRLDAAGVVRITDGMVLRPEVPVLRARADSREVASGADPLRALERWTPPAYIEDPVHRRLTPRAGASLALRGAELDLAPGARIEVDAGQKVRLASAGQLTIEGQIVAPGGDIALLTEAVRGTRNLSQLAPADTAIWVGSEAVLDVAGRAYVARDNAGLRYGVAPHGGAIRIGLDTLVPAERDFLDATHAFVILRPGARLEASGAAAEVDLPRDNAPRAAARPLQLAGDGGLIRLGSARGIFNDATLRAAAGGAGAAGGTLSLALENPPSLAHRVTYLHLSQQRVASGAAAELRPRRADASLIDGHARISVEELQQGGFGALDLYGRDAFSVEGDVDLQLAGSLALRRGVLSASAATPQASLRLAAPYVLLDGRVGIKVDENEFLSGLSFNSSYTDMAGPARNQGRLRIEAELVDVRGANFFGARGGTTRRIPQPDGGFIDESRPLEFHGFDSTEFVLRGDLRFSDGLLATNGDLRLTAAQLYPTTGAFGLVRVGQLGVGNSRDPIRYDSARSLVIRGNGAVPAMPHSVFGTLTLVAGNVDQGGVVRAPLGSLVFGQRVLIRPGLQAPTPDPINVVLRDGSVSSTSAAGLVLPYGGTADGINYLYRGQPVYFPDLAEVAGPVGDENVFREFINPGVMFSLVRLQAQPGSLVDVSGGGQLRGAGFFTGRGGSVDVLRTPLANANPAYTFSRANAGVYAIVPGYAGSYAPVSPDAGAGMPGIGQQITFDAPVGGLPAGTYTLLPSTYALLPGAFRVELGAQGAAEQFGALRASGSMRASGTLSVANTSVRGAVPSAVTLTPAQAVRSLSQYNEASYADFALANAAAFNRVRPRLERDAQSVHLHFGDGAGRMLDFAGRADLQAEPGGMAGNLFLTSRRPMEVVAPGTPGTTGYVTLDAPQLSAFNAGTLIVGGIYGLRDAFFQDPRGGPQVRLGPRIRFDSMVADQVVVRGGARLEAGQIFLAGRDVRVEGGALLDTTRGPTNVIDSSLGYLFWDTTNSTRFALLTVANGRIDFSAPDGAPTPPLSSARVDDGAMLRTRGTIGFLTTGAVELGEAEFNARYLSIAAPSIHVGTAESFAAAQAQGALGPGVRLSQAMLERLLRPTVADQTRVERLSLTAGGSLNFFGTVDMDLRAAGADAGTLLVLATPAIYGWGGAADTARIVADTLIWSGLADGAGTAAKPFVSRAPAAVAAGGPGTGGGRLVLAARRIEFGDAPDAHGQDQIALDRLALGFDAVQLDATQRITANRRNTLAVYRTGSDAAARSGGNLELRTPLLSGEPGSFMAYRAGGAVRVVAPEGGAADPSKTDAIGGEVRLAGDSLRIDTAVALPSGRLVLEATRDIALGDAANIDLAGRSLRFYDLLRHSGGGELVMESADGGIAQAAGSRIDVSAAGRAAGAVRVTAVGTGGTVRLDGQIRGGAPEAREAGDIDIRARALDDFAGLNRRLNAGGLVGGRRFMVKSGDLAIGDELRANRVEVSADGGSLTVNGRIDASGSDVGSIRLAARDDLVLAPGAVLDTHGTRLALDGRGQAIDAMNRAQIELTSSEGSVRLSPGVTLDLRAADTVARGVLQLNARRIGGSDVALSAPEGVVVRGAAEVAVNAFARYTPSDGVVDQAYFDALHGESQAFIDAAGGNGALRARMAGLPAVHLRPGVEIRSTGDLTVSREIDFSGYRYGPGADPALRGSGEPGAVVLRAGGNLVVNGSLSDGFAPPPESPDDYGWTNRPDGYGRMMALAPMLAPGMRSWSMRLAAGADLGSADSRTLAPRSRLGDSGHLLLDDPHMVTANSYPDDGISVIRTGTGALELLAGGDYRQKSLFGVYTAGTQMAGSQDWDVARARAADGSGSVLGAGFEGYEATLNAQRMYFADGGGDLLLAAQGNVRGYTVVDSAAARAGNEVGRWLWRQGGEALGQRSAWGINFGQYRADWLVGGPELVGFNGLGTLGGGNLTVRAGGDVGGHRHVTDDEMLSKFSTAGLDVVVAGSGRMGADGRLQQGGGGRLTMDVGGRINTGLETLTVQPSSGQVINLRGDALVRAGAIGLTLEGGYGLLNPGDPRAVDVHAPRDRMGFSGMVAVVGDGTLRLESRGDLVLLSARDAGRVALRGGETQVQLDGRAGLAASMFTLWTERSGIELFAAGGDIFQRQVPANGGAPTRYDPGRFSAIAANGSLSTELVLAPSRQGSLALLARDHLLGRAAMSGAEPGRIATVEKPLWVAGEFALSSGNRFASNFYGALNAFDTPEAADFYEPMIEGGVLFAYGPDAASHLHRGATEPIRLYALRGDVMATVGHSTFMRTDDANRPLRVPLVAKPVDVRAGRDVLLQGLALNNDADNISSIHAGRDILNTSFEIGGPGLLSVSAGRSILQGVRTAGGTINSIGPLVEGDLRDGAAVLLAAGMGAHGPDYAGFAARYFNPDNLADASQPLAEQAGKVAQTYEARLLAWLRERFGYGGDAQGALAAFLALPAAQQGVLVREVYYEELRQSGREYNDTGSRRAGSYLRGRNAIAALWPAQDAQGQPIAYDGRIGLQGDAGVHTDFGGGIQVLVPGGGLTLGANGIAPPPSTGLLTQGQGDIEIYTRDSVLLGLSRIFTTFGGSILAWSAEGDINAGRGSKTTVVYTPPKREYDDVGNVKLSPTVPSTGAGIATLAPIAEVPPGDVDLIAPLGTIDAGEAGIRVSGNVNLAALRVVNAANIEVKGESKGLPVVASVNVGALTNASAAAAQAATAAQDAMQRERAAARRALPSVFTVRVLGFGNESAPDGDAGTPRDGGARQPAGYRGDSAVQVLGDRAMGAAQRNQLTPAERRSLGL